MNKYAHFRHVLHFSGLAYGRHRVQGVKMGRLQPELAFQQIVSQQIRIRPYYIHKRKQRHFTAKQKSENEGRAAPDSTMCTWEVVVYW